MVERFVVGCARSQSVRRFCCALFGASNGLASLCFQIRSSCQVPHVPGSLHKEVHMNREKASIKIQTIARDICPERALHGWGSVQQKVRMSRRMRSVHDDNGTGRLHED